MVLHKLYEWLELNIDTIYNSFKDNINQKEKLNDT